MGEIDKAQGELEKARIRRAAEQEADQIRIEAAIKALNEKLRALQDQESALAEEMRAHADTCPRCAQAYVRSGVLAYKQCQIADALGVRADVILEEQQATHGELIDQQAEARPPQIEGKW